MFDKVEYKKQWYQQNKEKQKIIRRVYRHGRQAMRLFHAAQQRARQQGLEFTITKEDVIIPETCPYLGIQITNITGRGKQPTNASLDRIDASRGYTPDNVQVISDLANRMKQNATEEQLVAFAKGVLKLHDRTVRIEVPSKERELSNQSGSN